MHDPKKMDHTVSFSLSHSRPHLLRTTLVIGFTGVTSAEYTSGPISRGTGCKQPHRPLGRSPSKSADLGENNGKYISHGCNVSCRRGTVLLLECGSLCGYWGFANYNAVGCAGLEAGARFTGTE